MLQNLVKVVIKTDSGYITVMKAIMDPIIIQSLGSNRRAYITEVSKEEFLNGLSFLTWKV